MPDIKGPMIKVNRAKSHLDELSRSVKEFMGSTPYEIVTREEDDGDLVYRVKIKSEPPVEWSAIIGDIVHNLRSSLDLLAWQLVIHNGKTPDKSVYFPIGLAETGYGKQLRSSIGNASSKSKKLIRRLKPFLGGNKILTQLHALDICDKHRLILIVGSAHKHILVTLILPVPADWIPQNFKFPTLALNPADRQFPLTDGSEVFRVMKAARQNDSIADHSIVFELAFGDAEEVKGLPLLETLSDMEAYVRKIMGIFERTIFNTNV
ncbi:MAG: hypothetical protein AAF708_08720 [Deinococcota bacterium]